MKVIGAMRIVIEVGDPMPYSNTHALRQQWESRAAELKATIVRHVDLDSRDALSVGYECICSHCGSTWEMDAETKLPACCTAAGKEYERVKAEGKDPEMLK